MEMILNVMDSWQVPLLVHQLHQWHTTSWLDGWLHYQPSLFDCVTVGQQLRVSFGTILPIFLKLVHIWQTRSKKKVGTVFLRHGVYWL